MIAHESHAGHEHESQKDVGRGHEGHGHDHGGHSHGGHGHGPTSYTRAFAVGVALNLAFVATEVVYGLRADSLALLADAGHNFSDVLGLLLAWAAAALSKRIPSQRRTYGVRRFSILAALGNALLLLVAIGAIAWEAISRFRNPEPVASGIVMAVAAVGIVINGFTAWMFVSGGKDVNIRGAYLHMAADAGVSAAVVVAGFLIRVTGAQWLDPAMSLVVVAVIAVGTWGLLRESIDLALDAVPRGVDPAEVQKFLGDLSGVREVHDLHIWGMSTTDVALTAHLIRPALADEDSFLKHVATELQARFGIDHPTIQIERGHGPTPCDLAAVEVV
jgi:cobalt-zinc-cadmium efflux system protein